MKPIVEKIIMGIDPGTNVMGYGVIKISGNRAEMVAMGVIDLRKEGDMYLRFLILPPPGTAAACSDSTARIASPLSSAGQRRA